MPKHKTFESSCPLAGQLLFAFCQRPAPAGRFSFEGLLRGSQSGDLPFELQVLHLGYAGPQTTGWDLTRAIGNQSLNLCQREAAFSGAQDKRQSRLACFVISTFPGNPACRREQTESLVEAQRGRRDSIGSG
jgi:hypothetical protein